MSKADILFEELGFKYEKRRYADVYRKDIKFIVRQISFNKMNNNVGTDVEYLTMQELKAINQKCKELGWLNE